MKRIFTLCLILLLIISLAGCKSPSEVAAEKITEKILGDASGGKIDVDGEKVTIKADDGTEVSFGGNEWPVDKLGKDIPKLDGKVTYVANSEAMCMIVVEDIEASKFEAYLEKIKNAGYSQNETSYADSSTKTYIATNDDNIVFQLSYLIDSKEVSITVGKNEK